MRARRVRALAAASFAVTVVVETASAALSWGLEPRWDTLIYFVYAVVLAGVGALIARRYPENPIGWLFCGTALFTAVAADLSQGWGLRAATAGWPAGTLGEWISATSWIPAGTTMVLTFLLFPDGRLPSPGWRWLAWANVAGALILVPAWALSPDIGFAFVGGTNPYAAPGLPTGAGVAAGMVLFLGSFGLSVVPLAWRLRRSAGAQRQQLKWFAFAAVCAGVILPVTAVLWNIVPQVRPLAGLALTFLPVAAGIAILRYRLYDIDAVISRTVAYAILTVALAAAYGAAVLVIGTAAGRGSAWATAGATLVVAVAFRPLRDYVQNAVDRRFDRARYDALRQVAAFLDDLRAGRTVPERVEQVLRRAAGAERLELWILLPETGPPVDLHGKPVHDDPGDGRDRWPVRRGGTTLAVAVAEASPRLRTLLPALLDTGVLAIEIARLELELRRRLMEVEASRARIVAVADEERRRIERDLHDGAQQRLVSIGLALRHAQHALGPAVPEARRTIDDAVTEITVAIDELRELAQGLRPAQLDAGLGAALRELARRAPMPVEVDVIGERFAPDVESAAYFTACEGLTNAVKHAQATKVLLSAGRRDGKLVVRVADDGVGGADRAHGTGLTGLSDRVAAHGGLLIIDSHPGDGTTLVAEFPCAS